MDQKNLEYLEKSLDYLGFGTRLNAVLAQGMQKGEMSFSIGINQRYIPGEFRSDPQKGTDLMHYELRFNRSRHGEVYFLNAMEATLKKHSGAPEITKRFEMDKQNRMSALQAYKLLCGLSFEKPLMIQDLDDLQENKFRKVNVWFKMNFEFTGKDGEHPLKWFFPEYGYDLQKVFESYPFIGLEDLEKKESAVKALRFGNLITLPILLDGKSEEVYVAANPEQKNLNIFDQRMQAIDQNRLVGSLPVEPQQNSAHRRSEDQIMDRSEQEGRKNKR